MKYLASIVVACLMLVFAGTAGASDLSATPSSFSSVFANAQGGDTINLSAGNYGTFTGGTKASRVTIKGTGASVSMSLQFGSSASNIRLDGISNLGGWDISGSKNVEIYNSKFTGPVQVRGATSGIVFDNDTFNNLGHLTWEGRLSFGQGAGGAIVRNSTFGNGGCSDGIQFTGDAHDVVVDRNVFTGLREGSCTEHADPIQLYGARNITVTDNFFYNNSTGIMNADGNGSPMTIKNNVWVMDEYPHAIAGSGMTNSMITHNVVTGGDISLTAGNAGSGTGNTIRNNVTNLQLGSGSNTVDHNLTASQVTFANNGGRCGYALATNSAGKNAGSDGTDIGLNDCGSPTDPGPVDPPPVVDPPPPTVYTPLCAPTCDARISALSSQISRIAATADLNVYTASKTTLQQRILSIRAVAHE